MEPISLVLGLGTAISGAVGAFGKHKQAKAQTQASNLAASNRYRDALMMRNYQYGKEVELYNQRVKDYEAGIRESQLAYNRGYTALDKRAAERIAAARFAGQENLIKDIQTQGQFAAQGTSGVDPRAAVMARGLAGRRDALIANNLLRARYGDIEANRDLRMQANIYRRKLFSALPMVPTMAPIPSAPIYQQGPSALSLIGGLGTAAMSGLSAGMSAENMFGGGGGFGGPKALDDATFGKIGSGSPLGNAYKNFLKG